MITVNKGRLILSINRAMIRLRKLQHFQTTRKTAELCKYRKLLNYANIKLLNYANIKLLNYANTVLNQITIS